jgi:biotin synthase
VRKLYALYDNKICTGDEAAECRMCMEGRIRNYGFIPDMGRGDSQVEVASPLEVAEALEAAVPV